jgi:rhamnulokinase
MAAFVRGGRPGVVLMGSHVGKSTRQLERLLAETDAVGLEVVAGPEEASALGNIMVQARAVGLVDGSAEMADLARECCAIRRYSPRHRRAWEAAYGRFRQVLEKRANPAR